MRLPAFEIQGKIELPGLAGPPDILLSPDSGKLFISYSLTGKEPESSNVIGVYEAGTFRRISFMRGPESTGVTLPGPYFGPLAYFSESGTTIYDGLYRIALDSEPVVREWLNPVALLSAEQREKLRPFEQPNPLNSKPALTLVHVASSARGIAALTAFAPDDTQTAIVNVDLENRKILSIIVEKPDLRVTVLPDGARAFCEEIEWRKAGSRSDGEANKPGRFFVVDLQTGKRLMEFAALELAGREFDHRVIAVAPDGSSLLYGAGQSLFIVRLDVDRHSVLRVASSFDAKAAQCGFSNE